MQTQRFSLKVRFSNLLFLLTILYTVTFTRICKNLYPGSKWPKPFCQIQIFKNTKFQRTRPNTCTHQKFSNRSKEKKYFDCVSILIQESGLQRLFKLIERIKTFLLESITLHFDSSKSLVHCVFSFQLKWQIRSLII